MTRAQFLPCFYAFVAALAVGFIGATVLALFGIDSGLYQYGFGFLLAAITGYAVYKKAKTPKDLLK